MKKIHIALSSHNIEAAVQDYTARLACEPCVVIAGEYALWRTASLNLSVRQDANAQPGTLRHLGWEDAEAAEFTEDVDSHGIVWERFNAATQAQEIRSLWPETDYRPSSASVRRDSTTKSR
ncbi:hypothetical protein PN441_00895 [Spirulina major CS-329]|uniref:hypothetical protein n=1 Tax=Spirulina TaxID=1154 RepID=UPI00232B9857|nr:MULTISPECIES: hypothetical protein [Spirulina]MDB9496178.1 hypothetical protein [Spirulina subsalsa CS-330]MDB9501610.1 hypothetical protein [Spirulina major CS-329]